ncbi:MAG: hypothetical protein WAL30_00400 [Candidatus Aquirickettsiella sp.]
MKQINLLPWEQKNKLEKRQFLIVWVGALSLCIIFLFFVQVIIIQQIKYYQFAQDRILLQIKIISPLVRKMKKLQYEEKELIKTIKTTQLNRQRIRKILTFVKHLKYLITPDIYIRLIEFQPPYLRLIMHSTSENQCLLFIKILQLKYDPTVQWKVLYKSSSLHVDIIVKMMLDKKIMDT